MIGETLGSYRVTALLGAGGMGTVYLGEHTLLGSRAAIKVLRPELSEHTSIVQRFFDEARAATRVQHPGIVTVLDFGWQGPCAFLVMEYLTGETLASTIMREAPLPAVRALHLVRQCAVAMGAAHAANIVHRDLKPDNLFIVPDALGGDRVKVLDFGIAKLLDDTGAGHGGLTMTGAIMGTPAYMSPEQCRGAGKVDQRSDIYALGCVLFHMLTGRPPFVASTPGDLIAAHLTQRVPPPSALAPLISPALDQLVLDALEKDADRRISSMTALVTAIDHLDTLVPGDPTTTAVAPIAAPAVPVTATTLGDSVAELPSELDTPRRSGGAVVALIFALLAGAAVVGIAMVRRSGTHAAKTLPDAAVVVPDAATAIAAPIDAGTPAPDAPSRRAPPARHDAGTTPRPDASTPPRPDAGAPHRPDAAVPYDPLDNR